MSRPEKSQFHGFLTGDLSHTHIGAHTQRLGGRMKPNINNLAKLSEIKESLKARGVSDSTITTVANAVKNGLVIKRPKDIGLLSIPTADADLIVDAVTFGASQ